MKRVRIDNGWGMRRRCTECKDHWPHYYRNHLVCEKCGSHPTTKIVARDIYFYNQPTTILERIKALFGAFDEDFERQWNFREPFNARTREAAAGAAEEAPEAGRED